MSEGNFYKLLNLMLRAGGMGAKFVLILVLSKFLSDVAYRDFMLVITFVTLSIYVLGVDFYHFGIRDMLTGKEEENLSKLVHTFLFYASVYLFFGVVYYVAFTRLDFIKPYSLVIFFIALTEHLLQEIYRLLIAFGKVLSANVLLFFRLFGWAVYVLYGFYFDGGISVSRIFEVWFVFNSIGITAVSVYFVLKYWRQMLSVRWESRWISDGLKVSAVFFAGTVILKTIEYANRFVVDYFLDDIYVGIYGFYTTIALIVTIYINTIVISFELPPLIKESRNDPGLVRFKGFQRSMRKQLTVISLILIILIFPLLKWQGREDYIERLPVFFLVLTGVVLMNLSLVEHFMLYVKHKDKRILRILVLSGAFSLLSAILFTYLLGLYGTGLSFMLTGLMMYWLRKSEATKLFVSRTIR